MASVALCPRCSHDLFVPNDTDPDAWAQCSACNVLFQVRDAITRDLAELRLVEPAPELPADDNEQESHGSAPRELLTPQPTPTINISSQKTIDELDSPAGDSDTSLLEVAIDDEVATTGLPRRSAPTVEDFMKSSAPTWEERAADHDSNPTEEEASSDETEADLASARTIEDIPGPHEPPLARGDATIDLRSESLENATTDFELEAPSEPPESIETMATWDDSEQIDRLLAGDDAPLSDDALTLVPQVDPLAAEQEAAPTDQPFINTEMFSTPTAPRRRHRRSVLRLLIGLVLSGIIGLGLGVVALLWLKGPDGDILGIAHHLPRAILPAEFSSVPTQLADESPRRIDPDTEPAGFNAPATSDDAANKSMLDDVAAMQSDEPTRFEPSEATPLTGEHASRVTDAPTFTADELAVALQTAKEAQPGLIKGDLRDGKEIQHAKGYSYSMLCDLADKMTFVDATSRPDYIAALEKEAGELFRTTLADAHARGEVTLIVPRWLTFDKRKHGGVFFAGTIVGEVGKGSVVECRVDIGAAEPLTILVPKARADALDYAGRPVAVIGSIVDSPAQRVTGYEGDATQAVWVGRIIPLE